MTLKDAIAYSNFVGVNTYKIMLMHSIMADENFVKRNYGQLCCALRCVDNPTYKVAMQEMEKNDRRCSWEV